MVCAASAVVPRPSIPVPSEARSSTADPDCTPATAPLRLIARLVLLLCSAPRPVMVPLPLTTPVAAAKLASRASV